MYFDSYVVRLVPNALPDVLDRLRSTWRQLAPDYPFEYQFLDSQLENLYTAEQRADRIFGAFAGIAIFIACLGLFGLAAFIAEQRTQEIGIRKVLGATAANIVGLMAMDFLKLVAFGVTVAIPIAYVAMHRWLQDFAYRIELGPKVFLLAGGIALGIAFLTVSYQSIKAALTNPAESLRYE